MHIKPMFCLGLCLLTLLSANAWSEKILHEQRSLHSRLIVKQIGSDICLQFNIRKNQRNQSCINTKHPKRMVFSYTRMSMASLLFTPNPESVLVIGLGGGTIPIAFHELFPTAHIDAVEIDPAVVEVAKKYFGLNTSAQFTVHIQDARVWTKRAQRALRKYDIIILDAFNGEYIPEHLMTQEFLQEIQSLLSKRGVLVANTFAISELYHHESATYASVYGSFFNFRVAQSANRVVIAPVVSVDDETILSRAKQIKAMLKPYAIPITGYAKTLVRTRNRNPDWQQDARILTDQFSPANLLQR